MSAPLLRRQLGLLLRGHGCSSRNSACQALLLPGCQEQTRAAYGSQPAASTVRLLAAVGSSRQFHSTAAAAAAAAAQRLQQQMCSIQQLAASSSQLQSSGRHISTSAAAAAGDGQQPPQEHQEEEQQQQQVEPSSPVPAALDGRPPEEQQPQQQPPVSSAEQPAVQQPLAASATFGPRKVTLQQGRAAAGSQKREGVVHVNSTFNNTIMVLTDKDSKVKTWTSGGTIGYKNANKATPMAAELAAKELARRALELGFHSVVVKLKGAGKNKQFAVQSLAAHGLTVTQLQDVTPIPYNGCRLPRRRRV